jgi:hypothetical protein
MIDRPREDDTPKLLTTQKALLSTGISLYVRATSTSGQKGERGSIQLDRSKLSSTEWKDHQALLAIRHQALAYVNPSQVVGTHQWDKEIFFAIQLATGAWKAASATNQTGFHMATFEQLERMLPVAHKFLLEKFQKRIGTVSTLINGEGVDQSQMLKHQFDPIEKFGSNEAVERVVAGASQVTDAFWVNE